MKFDQITKEQLDALDSSISNPAAMESSAKAIRDRFFNEQPVLYQVLANHIGMALFAGTPAMGLALGACAMVYDVLRQQSSIGDLEQMFKEYADAPQN